MKVNSKNNHYQKNNQKERVYGALLKAGLVSAGLALSTMSEKPQSTQMHSELSRSDSLEFCLDKNYKFNDGDLEKYNSWIDEIIQTSHATGNDALIVDKSEAKMYHVKKGMLVESFPIDLGLNPFDDKLREGDRATPEGIYKISSKFPENVSTYYKALKINFPNKEDSIEFARNKSLGIIPQDASIGGSIEIHGEGSGKATSKFRYNWTFGCVALKNTDMDKIYERIELGTPIAIVKYTDKKIR
jgi:murein L,D-transpeptidase YafK